MKRQSSNDHSTKLPKRSRRARTNCIAPSSNAQKSQESRFPYGNHQIDQWPNDQRLSSFRKEWFENRNVLDIGCNAGFMTLTFALVFRPSSITGLDIDQHLIDIAKKNLAICQQMQHEKKPGGSSAKIFPVSLLRMYGPINAAKLNPTGSSTDHNLGFCKSVHFKCENYVLESDQDLSTAHSEFDTITALNVTKWVHLNWGDEGLKKFFKRVHAHLKPGGLFLLEPQPWIAYQTELKRNVSYCMTIAGRSASATRLQPLSLDYQASQLQYAKWQHLHHDWPRLAIEIFQAPSKSDLELKPEKFPEYLLSEIGFTAFHTIPTPGQYRPMYLFRKD